MTQLVDDRQLERPEPSGTGAHELRRGSTWALAAVTATSLGGFAFWVLAAATADTTDVGRAAAWFTVSQLAITVAAIGAPILINRRAGTDDASAITGVTVLLVFAVAAALGAAAPSVAGSSWSELSGWSGAQLSPFFAIGAGAGALALVVDARLISLRQWRWVLVRAATPAALRLPLLLIHPTDDDATWIAILAIVPVAISGVVALAALVRSGAIQLAGPASMPFDDLRFLLVQHAGALATHAPYHVIPLLVARQVSGPTNAAFYLIWGIGVMVTMVPHTLSQVLLSETSLDADGRVSRIRQTLAVNVGIGAVAWVGSILLAEPVLRVIDPGYADWAGILPWLLVAALCWSVTAVCLTEARLAKDGVTTTVITFTIAFLSITLAVASLGSGAVWSAVYAWVIAQAVAMVAGIIAIEWRRSSGAKEYLHG